jgi:hypothetical protein
MPALLFGAACVPLAYVLGRVAAGRLAGVLMAIMVCVDVTVTTQAHQARMYTQFLFWTMATLATAAWLLRDGRRPVLKVVLLGLFLALSVWTHFSALALLLATLLTGVGLLFRPADRRSGLYLVIAVALAALLSVQGLIKLYGMRDRPPLPGAGEHNAWTQILNACGDLMGNPLLCIALFCAAMTGVYVLARYNRRLSLLIGVSVAVGVINLLVASHYRHIEGQRYLLSFLPAGWLGLAVLNAYMLRQPNVILRRTFVALFVAGVLFQGFRTWQNTPHPMADPMRRAAATLPTLGYTKDQSLIFAPLDPMQMGGRYYGLLDDTNLHRRINNAIKSGAPTTPKTIGRARPDVLWMIVVAPCRSVSERNTPLDGVAAAQMAAGYFGQSFDPLRFPHDTDIKEMSIVRLTPDRADLWTVDGTPR